MSNTLVRSVVALLALLPFAAFAQAPPLVAETDPLPPDTVIVAGPAEVTADPWAHFQYHGWDNFDGPNVRFEQNLDGAGWLPVGDSLSMFNLADGPHTLWVRAVDSNGNIDPTPAEYQWTVDTAAPAVTILGPSVGYAPAGGTVTYTVVVEDPNLATNGLSAGDIPIRAIENTPAVHNVVVCTLCSCYPRGLLGLPPDWYKSREYRSRTVREPRAVLAEFGTVIPDSVEVRVHDSTADLRYLILPMRPAGTDGMDAAALEGLVTRDCMIGVSLPRAPRP